MYNITDNLNSFLLEFRSQMSELNKNQFKESCKIFEGVENIVVNTISPALYTKYIEQTIDNLSNIATNVDDLDRFFSAVYKSAYLEDKHISIPLQPENNVEKIRPEYLSNIALEFNSVVKKVISGDYDQIDFKKKYLTGDYFTKLKKQMVKTSVVTNDVRDLMVIDNPTIVKVDKTFIQSTVIPFIRESSQVKKDLNAIAVNVKGKINTTYTDMMSTCNAISSMQTGGKLDSKVSNILSYVKINMMNQFMNLCAYLTAMVIRKISYYSFNLMQYANLQNTLYNYFPEGDLILHESVIDGNLEEIDDTTLLNSAIYNDLSVIVPHIQNVIGGKKMEIANYMSRKYNTQMSYLQAIDFDKYPYDTYPYASANKTIVDIINNIHTLELSLNCEDCVVDDLIANANLTEVFSEKYSATLTNIPNTSFYKTQQDVEGTEKSVMMSLYNEINNFEPNMNVVCRNVSKCYQYLNALIDKFSTNSTQMNENVFNEVNSFLSQLMKNYKDYVLTLTKKFLERLDNLTEKLEEVDISDDSKPEEFVPYDYSFESYLSQYDEIVMQEKEDFENLLREYNKLRNKKERGINIVYEDTTEENNKTNTPSVQTNAQEQHNQNNNNTSTSTQTNNNNANNNNNSTTNTNNNGEKKESVVEIFKKWWKTIIDKFKDTSKKMTETNNKWLSSVKQKILDLNMDKTNITVAPYEDLTEEKINTDINGAITKINSINANNLPAELKGNKTKAQLFIFGTIPEKIQNQNSFGARIKHFFTFGKNDKENLVTYSGNDAKQKVSEMISFCEGYSNMYTSISNNLDKLTEAASNKQTDIINSLGQKNTNESVLFEADQTQVANNGSKVNTSNSDNEKLSSSSVITSIVREYSGSILTVIEKKYLDYIKVLNKLAPKDDQNNNETTTTDTQNKNNTEDQNTDQ